MCNRKMIDNLKEPSLFYYLHISWRENYRIPVFLVGY